MFVPPTRPDERDKPRHSSDTGSPHEAAIGSSAVLCPHQTLGHLRTLLRRQLECHTQEISQYGSQGLRLPLNCSPLLTPDSALNYITG